jgi:hypothetical protein
MGDSDFPERPEWFQPGTYSVWALERNGVNEAILFVAYEWETAGLRGVHVENAWLHEDEVERDWEKYPEFELISAGVDAARFARLVESGKVHRIGPMPQIGRYAGEPSWLV